MTDNGTAKAPEQEKSGKSSRFPKFNKSAKKRLALQAKREQQSPKNKRLTFLEALKNALASDAERRGKQHYSWTTCEPFNELVKLYGENFFEVIEMDNTPVRGWETRQSITPPRNLFDLYQDPKKIVGLRFGILTFLLLLDLDAGSPYHPDVNRAEFNRLLLTLEQMGLARYVIIRSSHSGGLHLLMASKEPLPSWMSAKTLYVFLAQAGFNIANGILEIFPHCKQFNPNSPTSYHGIRLPLQPDSGSMVLDPVTLEPIHADLKRLVQELKHDAEHQDLETFKKLMRIAYEDFRIDHKGRVKAQTGKAQEWLNDMLLRIGVGFTESGQTNDLILEVGKVVYVFRKGKGEEAVKAMAEWVQNLPGYTEHCHHQHEIERRCREWYNCITKLYYPYDGQFRERLGLDYGGTIQAIAAKLEDGRSHNPANATRQQDAEQRLAKTILKIRQDIRQGLITVPHGITAWIKQVIATGKALFGKGFSIQFLYQFKGLFRKLQAFALRVARSAVPVVQPAPSVPVVTQTPPVVIVVVNTTKLSVPSCKTNNTLVTKKQKSLKPAQDKGLLSISQQSQNNGIAETRTEQGITSNSPIYEGGGEGNLVGGDDFRDTAIVSTLLSSKEQFPYEQGQKIKFQHESFQGWRKGIIVKIDWQEGYFVNCLIQFSVFVTRSRYRPGEWVQKVVKLFNINWIQPLSP